MPPAPRRDRTRKRPSRLPARSSSAMLTAGACATERSSSSNESSSATIGRLLIVKQAFFASERPQPIFDPLEPFAQHRSALAHDGGHVEPGEVPVDAQDEERLIVGRELPAQARDALLHRALRVLR